jgi:aspartyl-tRNA(Asn)/glutamyl-tRNA(Gln) amidotransferase subunit B
MSAWETVIGLEVHVQLLTRTKMFCGCSTTFGDPPNTNVCPVCLGLPGALPVPNEHALRLAVRAAYGLGLTVHARSSFARKNYFYPDLPKGYQISQHTEPLSTGGRLEVESPDRGAINVGITRIHVEEDAAKSFHDKVPGMTAVDFNRSGVPLIEIVGEPDLRSPAEARAYLTALKQVLLYLGVSDCSMEEGSLRVDANVSVRPAGSAELRTRCEIKNLNSFSNVERALSFERDRQIVVYESGGAIEQRTMTFDAGHGEVRPTRSKEESHDYRYFPEPDLPPLVLTEAWLATERATLPELPAAKRARFAEQYGLTRYEAGVLTAEREQADLYELAVAKGGSPKSVATWMMNEVDRLRAVYARVSAPVFKLPSRLSSAEVYATAVAAVSQSVETGDLNRQGGRQLLEEMAAKPERLVESLAAGAPRAIAASLAKPLGILQVSNSGAIDVWVREVVEAHPAEAARYRGGEEKVFGFLVGRVMRRSSGRADPKLVNAALQKALKA